MLNVQNVTHGFGERQILDNASFRMKKGEHIGLVGANGEGKTTFLPDIAVNPINPWNILAITFTNKAANEMRERVEYYKSQNKKKQC